MAGEAHPYTARAPFLLDADSMISHLVERLKKSPDDVEGWRMLGWSYFHTKNYKKSFEAYDRALHLNPVSEKLQAVLRHVRNKVEEPVARNASE